MSSGNEKSTDGRLVSPSSAANEVLATDSGSSGSDPGAKEDVLATGSASSRKDPATPLLRAVNFSGARDKVLTSGSDPGAKEDVLAADVLATDVLTGSDPTAMEDVLTTGPSLKDEVLAPLFTRFADDTLFFHG